MKPSPTERFHRVDAVLDAVLDLPDAERRTYIERVCGHDAELYAELRVLLEALRHSEGFLETPAAEIAGDLLEEPELPDPAGVIGAFRIVRELGRGGMGAVFLGERADGQFEQRVALKLIQRPASGLVKRFLEERRILALLEHPGIARLIDGGISANGLPYFAMEFVDGEPIDRYCEARQLPIERRLELFADVCAAVSYAHQNLVIHRDLKPSNILVTSEGQVKLLDFGIAKLLSAESAGADATRPELKVMTPEFAAPEQVRGDSISTATDVYSLGVLLYVLLTGERPYEVRGRSAAEVERIVCHEEPPRPSSRAPAPLRRRLRGDLDIIVLTALQKSAPRRYQSPAALAQDLQRFREGHPILARPDSTRYRVSKFVIRHRTGVAVAALLAAALTGAALRERVLRNAAETEARKAKEVEDFLVRVFDVADPYAREDARGGTITARELLDRGAARIDSTLTAQPAVQAELRSVLGRVYTNLGLFDRATPLLEQSLVQRRSLHGPQHASVAAAMDLLGTALMHQDRYAEAEPLLRDALEQRRRLFGNASTPTAETVDHLARLLEQRNEYEAAEPLYREVLAIREAISGDSTVDFAAALNNLGLLLYRKGAYADAEPLYRRALDVQMRQLGENHPSTAETLQNLAQALHRRANYQEAETYHRRALEAKRNSLGDAHPSVTISLNNLGNLLARQLGRLDEGEALTREALELDRQMFGENHSYVAEGLSNLAVILRMKGEFVGADTLLRRALSVNRRLFGEPHAAVALNYSHLANTRYLMGDDAGAIDFMRRAVAQYREVVGEDHLNTLVTAGTLGNMLSEVGDPVEAESILRASLTRLDPQNSAHRTQHLHSTVALGKALLAQGRADDAVPVLAQALNLARQQFGDSHVRTAGAQLAYGKALLAKRRFTEAEPHLLAAHATLDRERTAQPRLAAQADIALATLRRVQRR